MTPTARRIGSAIASLAVVVGAACGPNDAPRATPSRFLIPLTVGNQWTYLVTDSVFGAGVVPSSRPDSTYVQRVVRDTLANGSTWSVLETHMSVGDALVGTTYETIASGGLYRLDPVANSASLLVPFPAILNFVDLNAVTEDGPAALVSFDTLITTPAGAFHCLRYSYVSNPPNALDPNQTVFISLGIGVVLRLRRVEAAFDGTGRLTGHQDRMQILTAVNAH